MTSPASPLSPVNILCRQPSSDSMDSDEDNGISPFSPPISPLKPTKKRTRTISQSQLGRTSSTKIAAEPIVRYGNKTIYTHGRPPWYDTKGEIKEPFLIGICGGSASGKTTVAKSIIEDLDVPWVSLVSLDSFYKVLTPEEKLLAADNNFNFDHPSAFDFESVEECLKRLKQGKSVSIPIYDFTTHSRLDKTKTIYGANVIIFEGILAFTKSLLPLMDLKVFVDTDSDERLVRRLRRDISERGRDLHGVLDQCNRFVKPAYEQFIAPSMTQADIIIPRGGQNHVAIDLIVQHVNKQLKQRGHSIRHQLFSDDTFTNQQYPDTLHVLPNSKQVTGLHTLVRSADIDRDAFVFYSDRLMRLLCEFAMSLLPYKDVIIDTPQGTQYNGKRLAVDKLVAVSILRAGETLEPALCAVAKDVCLSKILIQTNIDTQEPELHYLRLPKDIANCHVMLLDSTVATGAAAIMAIRVLLEHDVAEENIMLMSLLMAAQGVHSIAYSYPKVKIVTTAVDERLNENYHIIPGLGNFGDRYFGTGPVETDHNTTQD